MIVEIHNLLAHNWHNIYSHGRMFISLMYSIVCCLNSRALFGVSTFQGLVIVSGRSTLNDFHVSQTLRQGLSQDLETGCPKMAIVNFFGVQIFKGDHNILRFQP